MKPFDMRGAIELVGIAAVVIGLFMVFEELRQARTIARAELSAETTRLLEVLNNKERDSEFAAILVKSQKSPATLTVGERLQMNSYLRGAIIAFTRERYNYRLGIFETWDELPYFLGPYYFGSGYGRAYWEATKDQWNPELVEVVDRGIEEAKSPIGPLAIDNEILVELQRR